MVLLLVAPGGCGGGGAASPDDAGTGADGGGPGVVDGGGGGGDGGGPGVKVPVDCTAQSDDQYLRLAVGAALPAGTEQTMCLRVTLTEDLEISAFKGTLGPTGHHALLVAHTEPSAPDGAAPCNEAELMDSARAGAFQLVAGVSYESDGVPFDFPAYPAAPGFEAQVGLRVPAGSQLILDAHLLNASPEARTACTTLELRRDRPVTVPLEFVTLLPEEQYALSIPPRSTIDVGYELPVGERVRVGAVISHMHQGAERFRLSVKETGRTLYETTEWAEPTPALFATEQVVLEADQTFRMDCTFTNDSDAEVRFPDQMCVGALYVLPCTFPLAC